MKKLIEAGKPAYLSNQNKSKKGFPVPLTDWFISKGLLMVSVLSVLLVSQKFLQGWCSDFNVTTFCFLELMKPQKCC